MTPLAPLLERFFCDRLLRQRGARPNTIAAYRDTFRLLLVFVKERSGKVPWKLIRSVRPGRTRNRCLPRPPRARPAQHRTHS